MEKWQSMWCKSKRNHAYHICICFFGQWCMRLTCQKVMPHIYIHTHFRGLGQLLIISTYPCYAFFFKKIYVYFRGLGQLHMICTHPFSFGALWYSKLVAQQSWIIIITWPTLSGKSQSTYIEKSTLRKVESIWKWHLIINRSKPQ